MFSRSTGSKSRALMLGTFVSLFAILATACGSGEGTQSEGDGVLKIGVISAETGFASSWGIPWQVTWQMAADEVNADGGLDVGGQKYTIEILTADDKFDPTLGRSAAERFLTRDGVNIIASANDPTSEAILDLAAQNDAIVIGAFYTANLMKTDHSFGVVNQYWQTAEDYLNTIKEVNPDAETVAMLNLNFTWGVGMAEAEEAAAPNAGLTWLGADLLEPGVTDLAPAVSKVVNRNPDVFSIGCFGADVGTVIQTARDLGYTGILASNCQADIAQPLRNAGEAAEGYIQVEDAVYPPLPALEQLREEYESRGFQWVGDVARYWYAPRALFNAIESAGTVEDTEEIMSALEEVEFPATIAGDEYTARAGLPYQGDDPFSEKHQLLAPFVINMVEDGEITTLGVFQAPTEAG